MSPPTEPIRAEALFVIQSLQRQLEAQAAQLEKQAAQHARWDGLGLPHVGNAGCGHRGDAD